LPFSAWIQRQAEISFGTMQTGAFATWLLRIGCEIHQVSSGALRAQCYLPK